MSVRTRQGREIDDSDRPNVGLGRTALVTGASSGIGRSMSQLLAAKGFDVVLVARREGMLRSLATELDQRWGRQRVPLVADLSQPTAMAEITTALRSAAFQVPAV